MPRNLDPTSPEMRAQTRMLRGIRRAGLELRWCAVVLADVYGGTVETWRTRLSRATSGTATLGLGVLGAILDEVTVAERLIIVRAMLEDSGLSIELETWPDDDDPASLTPEDIGRRSMDAAEETLATARADWAGCGSASRHRHLADVHRHLAAACESRDAAAVAESALKAS